MVALLLRMHPVATCVHCSACVHCCCMCAFLLCMCIAATCVHCCYMCVLLQIWSKYAWKFFKKIISSEMATLLDIFNIPSFSFHSAANPQNKILLSLSHHLPPYLKNKVQLPVITGLSGKSSDLESENMGFESGYTSRESCHIYLVSHGCALSAWVMNTACVLGSHRGQKGALAPLEL